MKACNKYFLSMCIFLSNVCWALDGGMPTDGWWTILKTLLALVLMSVVLFGLLYLVKKMQMSVPGLSRHMKVVGAVPLGQKERLVMIEIYEEWLILGVTSHQIQVLHRLPKPPPEERPEQMKQSFMKILHQKMGQHKL
jgi:flagellar protein FliO/FliZ